MRNYDFSNYFMFFILFSIGTSAVGMISAVLVSWLGFPYTWSGLVTLPLLLLLFFLIYKGYPIQTWLVVGCVGFILLAAIAFVRGFTTPKPNIPAGIPETYLEDYVDPTNMMFGDYSAYYDNYELYDAVLEADQDDFLIMYGYTPRTDLTIEFPPVETSNGEWAFVEGAVRVSGGMNGNFPADPDMNWMGVGNADFLPVGDLFPARPFVTTSLPITAVHVDQPLTLQSTLTIAYPAENGVEEQTLTRTTQLFIASQQFTNYQMQYSEWQRTQRVKELPTALILIVGSVVSGIGAFALVRAGGLQPSYIGSGLLRFEIIRASGAKRLGVEAHPLNKFAPSARGSVEQGVILGWVNPQSPAGRAGLRAGDILVSLNDKPVNSPGALSRIAGRGKKGELMPVSVVRGGTPLDLTVRF